MCRSPFSLSAWISWDAGQEPDMTDVTFVLCTILFFALGILYLKGCERLK